MLYYESLRFTTLTQTERKNELLFALSQVWRKDISALGQLLVNGWPACVCCYKRVYGF